MADPHWTSYVGMATGIAGAITGLYSLHKANKLKSLDLRLEIKKSLNDIYINLPQAYKILNDANNTHMAVASMKGRIQSGTISIWKKDVEADKDKLNQLSQEINNIDLKCAKLNQNELESMIIEIHKIKVNLLDIKGRYAEVIRSHK